MAVMKWYEALRLWNSEKKKVSTTHAWIIPRKGSPEHEEVVHLMHTGEHLRRPQKKTGKVVKESIPDSAPPPDRMAKAIEQLRTVEKETKERNIRRKNEKAMAEALPKLQQWARQRNIKPETKRDYAEFFERRLRVLTGQQLRDELSRLTGQPTGKRHTPKFPTSAALREEIMRIRRARDFWESFTGSGHGGLPYSYEF